MKTKLIIHPFELDRDWVDRMCELGVDTLGIHPEGGGDAHKKLAWSLGYFRTEGFREGIDYARSRGLRVEYEMHVASYLLPRELFSEHPEWFRMDREGKRTPQHNFCVSNAEALDFVANRALELADQLYGSEPCYYFWLDDVKDSYCHCPRCPHLSPSDQNLTVMNAMLRALRRREPEATLAYLAYYECMMPPGEVAPEEGIFLEYAPFERDMTKSAQLVPDSERENLQRLFDFFGREQAWLLEYWYDNSWYTRRGLEYSVDNAVVADDVRYYRALGFKNISSFACFLAAPFVAEHGVPDLSGING